MVEPISMFLTLLIQAAGKAGAAEGIRVLRETAGLQDAQTKLLRAIDVKVDALLQGPFRTGRLQLHDALADHRGADDRAHLLREARASFTTALGQDDEPLRRSFAALHLAAVWLALEAPSDVRRTLAQAHAEALRAVDIELRRKPGEFNLFRVLGSQTQIAHDERQRFIRSAAIVPYANDLARARYAWTLPGSIGMLMLSSSRPPPIPVLAPTHPWTDLVPDPWPALASYAIAHETMRHKVQLGPYLIEGWLIAYDRGEMREV